MQSSIFEMGKQRGEQNTMARLYERRLQRPLSEGERAALSQRLEKLGADRMLDVPVEMSPDALAAWLGDPAAN